MSKSKIESVKEVLSSVITTGPKNEQPKGEDEGVFTKLSLILKDFSKSFQDRNYAFEVFEKNLLFLKSFGLAFIIILCAVNYFYYKRLGLIASKPFRFMIESFVFGISGVIPFLMLSFLRNNNHFTGQQIFQISVGIFIIFFLLNYMLELSGIYPALFESKHINPNLIKTQDKDKENKEDELDHLKSNIGLSSDIILLTIFGVSFLFLFYTTYFIRDTDPSYCLKTSVSPSIIFLIETLLFGVISAISIFLISYNRNALSSDTYKEFLLITFKFSLFHILLQLSGFYRYVFNGKIKYD